LSVDDPASPSFLGNYSIHRNLRRGTCDFNHGRNCLCAQRIPRLTSSRLRLEPEPRLISKIERSPSACVWWMASRGGGKAGASPRRQEIPSRSAARRMDRGIDGTEVRAKAVLNTPGLPSNTIKRATLVAGDLHKLRVRRHFKSKRRKTLNTREQSRES
jgi:hypothetical protein